MRSKALDAMLIYWLEFFLFEVMSLIVKYVRPFTQGEYTINALSFRRNVNMCASFLPSIAEGNFNL